MSNNKTKAELVKENKQLRDIIKELKSVKDKQDADLSKLPYLALSKLTNRKTGEAMIVKVRYDLDSKAAQVEDVVSDSRGPHMVDFKFQELYEADVSGQEI